MLIKSGKQMSEESLNEHLKAFSDVEESIEILESEAIKKNPKSKYMKLRQQSFDFNK